MNKQIAIERLQEMRSYVHLIAESFLDPENNEPDSHTQFLLSEGAKDVSNALADLQRLIRERC